MATPPLNQAVAIVDDKGRPTPDFIRWWEQQRATNDTITPISTATEVGALLDKIGSTQGMVLYRDSGNWNVLAPGIAGRVLTTNGAAANPTWNPAAAGVSTFTGLTDTPANYTGAAGQVVTVNPGETGLVFAAGGGGGALAWSADLLTNGNFETGTGAGWTTDIGAIRIAQWALMTDYGTAGMTVPNNGTWFYNGGETGFGGAQANVSSFQDVDISTLNAVGVFIDAVAYKNFADTDFAVVGVQFLASGGAPMTGFTEHRTPVGTQPIGAYPLGITAFVPPGAATARARITCTRGSGTNNNVGLDNVRLRVLA